jgi:dipeptidyl aminopeptidase/acylaminoacyl peptidase
MKIKIVLLKILSVFLFAIAINGYSQTPEIVKPADNLIVKNIPAIPAAITSAVRQYTESRSAFPTVWHPQRREMIIATRFGNTTQLHYLKMPGGARTQITFFEEQVGNADFEPINGDYFIFSKDSGGNEFSQLYRYDMKDGKVALLSDGGRTQNGNVVWNKAKNRISFTSTKRNGTDRDIYTMDPRNPSSAKLIHEVKGGGWSVSDWSPDDKKLIIQQGISVNESMIYLLDMESNHTKLISPVNSREAVANVSARFSNDGTHIFFITDYNNEFKQLARVDADGKNWKNVTSGLKWDVSNLVFEEGARRALFVSNENGISTLYLINLITLEWKPVKGMPVGLLGSFSWRKNSDEFFFSFSSAKNNSDVYTHDLKTGKTERWTQSELGGIVESSLREPQLIQWKSFDGLMISGFYYPPSDRFVGKRPVIINIHGGPEGQSLPGFQGRNNYFLEELGVAVIYPNVRGSTGFGKNFVKLDNGMLREIMPIIIRHF